MRSKLGIDREIRRIHEMAPMGYFLHLHIRCAMALYASTTYPDAWKQRYSAQGYQRDDPIFEWGFSADGVVRWDELPEVVRDPIGIMADAARFGLRHGVCCAVGPMTSRTVVAAAREDEPFSDAEMQEFAFLVRRMHKVSEPPRSLTRTQVEALRRIEAGEPHEVAAASLGVSLGALKARLSAARGRLRCATTAETVEMAKTYGLM